MTLLHVSVQAEGDRVGLVDDVCDIDDVQQLIERFANRVRLSSLPDYLNRTAADKEKMTVTITDRTIFKERLHLHAEPQPLRVEGASVERVLHFAVEASTGRPAVWFEVWGSPPVNYLVDVRIIGTGRRWPAGWDYEGSVQLNGFVWHLLSRKRVAA